MPPRKGMAIPLTMRTNPGVPYSSPTASWAGAGTFPQRVQCETYRSRAGTARPPDRGGNAQRINYITIIAQYIVFVNTIALYFTEIKFAKREKNGKIEAWKTYGSTSKK